MSHILYSNARKNFKTGDLIAWKTTKINSFATFILCLYQKIVKAEYIHVGIVVREGRRVFILEATPPVVRLFPLSLTDDFYYIDTNIPGNTKHVDNLLLTLGKQYSVLDFIKSLLKLSNNENDYYCSELAFKFYNEIGYINDLDAGTTPDSLVKAVLKVTNTEPVFIKNDKGNLNGL